MGSGDAGRSGIGTSTTDWKAGLPVPAPDWHDAKYGVAAFGRNITDKVQAVGAISFNNLTGMLNEPRLRQRARQRRERTRPSLMGDRFAALADV